VDGAVIDAPDRPDKALLAHVLCEKHNRCRRRDGWEWPHGVHLKDAALDEKLIVQRSGKVDGTATNDGTLTFSALERAEHGRVM
jgi:hypothetical protein